MNVPCAFCRRPVNPAARTTYRRVEGWERKALSDSRKSGSDIVLREHRDQYACPQCIARLRSGLAAGQEALL